MVFLIRRMSTMVKAPSNNTDFLINIRHATCLDIPGIRHCNEKTLPENYPTMFYEHSLRKWPRLSMVAEALPDENVHDSNNPNKTSPIIGYVLGRMEDNNNPHARKYTYASK